MSYAFVLCLCVVAAPPVSSTAQVEVEAAARAFRIESYNQRREDREAYRQLRDADDELRLALSATSERDLAQRQEEAVRWYQEATEALHAGGEVPASPVWLTEALADAETGKIRDKNLKPASRSQPAFVQSQPAVTAHPSQPKSQTLPPTISPAKTKDEFGSPFFFVDAALRAAGNLGAGESSADAPAETDASGEIADPVIFPAGPIVDELPALPTGELPTLSPVGEEPKAEDMPVPEIELPSAEPVEPSMELPTLDEPAMELPSLPSLDGEDSAN